MRCASAQPPTYEVDPRTLGASGADVLAGLSKVQVASRSTAVSHTAERVDLRKIATSLLMPEGLAGALDCDVLVCCVDRPWPRFLLNASPTATLTP